MSVSSPLIYNESNSSESVVDSNSEASISISPKSDTVIESTQNSVTNDEKNDQKDCITINFLLPDKSVKYIENIPLGTRILDIAKQHQIPTIEGKFDLCHHLKHIFYVVLIGIY